MCGGGGGGGQSGLLAVSCALIGLFYCCIPRGSCLIEFLEGGGGRRILLMS